MSTSRNRLFAGAFALGLLAAAAPIAYAQTVTPPPAAARNANRHMDGRVAFLKAELKITPAQQAAFDNYVKVLRQNADEMQASMKQRPDKRSADAQRPAPSAIEQLERRAEMSKMMAAQSQRSLDAFKPLYTQLSDEQKKAADELLGGHGRGGHGPRHRA